MVRYNLLKAEGTSQDRESLFVESTAVSSSDEGIEYEYQEQATASKERVPSLEESLPFIGARDAIVVFAGGLIRRGVREVWIAIDEVN